MTTDREFLPCPFCGGNAERDTWDKSRDYAGCSTCDYWVQVNLWNTRARLSQPQPDAGRLEAKERDRQYHMDAINRLASFLAFHGTSFEVIQAAIDNMTRMAKELAALRGKEGK